MAVTAQDLADREYGKGALSLSKLRLYKVGDTDLSNMGCDDLLTLYTLGMGSTNLDLLRIYLRDYLPSQNEPTTPTSASTSQKVNPPPISPALAMDLHALAKNQPNAAFLVFAVEAATDSGRYNEGHAAGGGVLTTVVLSYFLNIVAKECDSLCDYMQRNRYLHLRFHNFVLECGGELPKCMSADESDTSSSSASSSGTLQPYDGSASALQGNESESVIPFALRQRALSILDRHGEERRKAAEARDKELVVLQQVLGGQTITSKSLGSIEPGAMTGSDDGEGL